MAIVPNNGRKYQANSLTNVDFQDQLIPTIAVFLDQDILIEKFLNNTSSLLYPNDISRTKIFQDLYTNASQRLYQ